MRHMCKESRNSCMLLDQIADKWSIMILAVLGEHPLHLKELKRRLEGVTQKALTEALWQPERNDIV